MSVSLCVSNGKLGFSDSSLGREERQLDAAITTNYVPYLCKLGFPGHKMVGFGNVGKAETDRKFSAAPFD